MSCFEGMFTSLSSHLREKAKINKCNADNKKLETRIQSKQQFAEKIAYSNQKLIDSKKNAQTLYFTAFSFSFYQFCFLLLN